jgi:hypothetical protein
MPDGSEHMLPEGAPKSAIDNVVRNYLGSGQFIDPEAMTESSKAGIPQGRINLDPFTGEGLANIAKGGAETLATIGTGAIAAPIAYAAGIGDALISEERGAGPETIERVQSGLTYMPQSVAGQKTIGALGEGLEATLGSGGLDVLGKGPEMSQQAVEKYNAQPLEETTFYIMPDILQAITGLKAIRSLQGPVKLKNPDGSPTPELENILAERNLVYAVLSDEAKKQIPAEINRKAISGEAEFSAKPIIEQEIKRGQTQRGLAESTRSGGKDISATQAIDLGFDPAVVQTLKVASGPTRFNMFKMVNDMESLKADPLNPKVRRPTETVGDVIQTRMNFLTDKKRRAGTELKQIAEQELKGVEVPYMRINDLFAKQLDDLNIKYEVGADGRPLLYKDGKSTLNFEGSIIQPDEGSQIIIRKAADLIGKTDNPDAYGMHILKQQLDSLINWEKLEKNGIPESGRKFAKGLRTEANEIVRELNPRYARMNDVLSRIIDTEDNLLDSMTRAVRESVGEGDYRALGQEFRKLFSEYGNSYRLDSALRQLDETVDQFKQPSSSKEVGPYDPNAKPVTPPDESSVYSLARFSKELDKVFGPAAIGNYQATQAAGITQAARGLGLDATTNAAVDAGLSMTQKALGKTPRQVEEERLKQAYASIKEVLRNTGVK